MCRAYQKKRTFYKARCKHAPHTPAREAYTASREAFHYGTCPTCCSRKTPNSASCTSCRCSKSTLIQTRFCACFSTHETPLTLIVFTPIFLFATIHYVSSLSICSGKRALARGWNDLYPCQHPRCICVCYENIRRMV